MDIYITSCTLLVTLYLLISEKISVALTAIGIMVLLTVSSILTPAEAVAGFANPAVVTVAAMFVVSKGIVRTGGVEFLSRQILALARGNVTVAMVIILMTVGVASAFINNTPVVILFIPVIMSMCCEFGLSPSKFLIPVSYASILAGTCTLIGTSTNIIISDLSATYGYPPLAMFELATLGVPVAMVGILILLFIAPKILPNLASPVCHVQGGEHKLYIAELKIPPSCPLVGTLSTEVFSAQYPSVQVVEHICRSHVYHPERENRAIFADDILLVKGNLNDLVDILRNEGVELPRAEQGLFLGPQKDSPVVLELVITPYSSLIGQKLEDTELATDAEINIIALKRSKLHLSRQQLKDVQLKNGDVVLVWCTEKKIDGIRHNFDYIVVEDVHEELVHKRKAVWAMVNFACMIGTATLGIADIMICSLTAAFLMIITGCLQMRDAYKALHGDVLLLIVGTIALGTAMLKTGTSQLYAEAFLRLFHGFPPTYILGAMIMLTSISTQILSNNATAVLLLPIAVSTAIGIGVDPRPFIIGVCFGASACFATPVGYKTNLLVYAPGGYSFMDYLKLGIPLNVFVVVAATVAIPYIWPFFP